MVAKYGTLFWLAIAVILWVVMIGRSANLIASAAIGTVLIAYAFQKLDQGAWQGFRKVVVKHCWAIRLFVATGITTFCLTSMIAGDWDPAHRITTTCLFFGQAALHIHHWAKGLAAFAKHGELLHILHRDSSEAQLRAVRLYGKSTLNLTKVLLVIDLVLVMTGNGNPTLWLDVAGYSIYFFILALVCLHGNPASSWFRIYIGISVAISLAIALSGAVEMLKDLVIGGQIPSTFIFWHGEGDPACRP